MTSSISALPLAPQPQVPTPGDFVAEQCWGSTEWVSDDGVRRALADMETSHLWNVLSYLRWHAPALREATEPQLRLEVLDLRTWLAALPMWRAMSRELRRREELLDHDRALQTLENASAVPWQLDGETGP